ncbi:hypothetical protein B0H13DRAFT_1873048 [Mycena leptocephala]|nr:hypothetical protein B0H13DRAFT_1873048 [Mycena leptocephala]
MPGAFLRTLANHWQEAEAMVEIGESTERSSRPVAAAGRAGVIRLSTKYDVASLRNRALTHLSSAFPITRAEFPGSPSWQIPDHEWIRVVLFAREMSIEWILPIAFYRVAEKCTPAQLLHGIVVDGVPFNLTPQDKLTSIEYSLSAEPHMRRSRSFWFPGVPRVTNQTRNIVSKLGSKLAQCCKGAMRVARQKSLDTLWAGLPKRFGPPGWEALRQMKKANLG